MISFFLTLTFIVLTIAGTIFLLIILADYTSIKPEKVKGNLESAYNQKDRNKRAGETRQYGVNTVPREKIVLYEPSVTNEPYYFVFDCETTGLPHPGDTIRIVQLAWMILDKDFNRIKEANHYLNPGSPIPIEAIAVHHITDQIVQEKATPHKEALTEFYNDLEKARWIVAHNFSFDAKCVDFEIHYANIKKPTIFGKKNKICTMLRGTDFCKIGPIRYGEYKWPKLEELALECGFRIRGLHNASVDVRATGFCLKKMVERGWIKRAELEYELPFPQKIIQESKIKKRYGNS